MKKIVVSALFSLLIAACGGMDPGTPDPNDPGMAPNTDSSSDALVIESCGDSRVTWLQGRWASCPSDGETEAPEGALERFYQRENACFLSSDAVNGTLLTRAVKTLDELMAVDPNDETPSGVYADQSTMTLTFFYYAENSQFSYVEKVNCTIQ